MSEESEPRLTFDQYEQKYGVVCPFCETAGAIQATDFGFAEWGAYTHCRCEVCHEEWTEEFEMARVTYGRGNLSLK